MKTSTVELSCDQCGDAEHFPLSQWVERAKESGWLLTRAGKHYCCNECYYLDGGSRQHGRRRK